LEFSGQKLTHSNIFSKHTHQKQNHHERDQNEVLNYELTFSNTKLAHELSEINNVEDEHADPLAEEGLSGAISMNESQLKKHNLSWDRELSQYEVKK
jgi:hypothetical protein